MKNEQSLLKVKDVTKVYSGAAGSKTNVLESINFELGEQDGAIYSILAPFGSGKTTLLKIISALEKPTEGEVFLNSRKYEHPNGEIVYIPENPVSFPWWNVKANIEFGLKTAEQNNIKPLHSYKDLMTYAGLEGYDNHLPSEKSLGFRFRITIARSLAVNPKLILIDDSFKKIDYLTRSELFEVVKNIAANLKMNFLIAGTNVSDAIFLSDCIFMLKKNPGTIFKEIKKEYLETKKKDIDSLKKEIESDFTKMNIIQAANITI